MSSSDVTAAREKLAAVKVERAALAEQLASLRYAADLTRAEERRRSAAAASGPPPTLSPSAEDAPAPGVLPAPRALEAQLLADKASATAARLRVHALQAEAAVLRRRAKSARHMSALVGLSAGAGAGTFSSPVLRARRGSLGTNVSPTRRAAERTIADFDALVHVSLGDSAAELGAGVVTGAKGESDFLPCRVSILAAGAISLFPVATVEEEAAVADPTAYRGNGAEYTVEGSLVDRLLTSSQSRLREAAASATTQVCYAAKVDEPVLTLSPPFVQVSTVNPLPPPHRAGNSSRSAPVPVPENISKWMSTLPIRIARPEKGGDEGDALLCGLTEAIRDAKLRIVGHSTSPLPWSMPAKLAHSPQKSKELPPDICSTAAESRSDHWQEGGGAFCESLPPAPSRKGPSLSPPAPTQSGKGAPWLSPTPSTANARTPASTALSIASEVSSRLASLGFGRLNAGRGVGAHPAPSPSMPARSQAQIPAQARAGSRGRGRGRGRGHGRGQIGLAHPAPVNVAMIGGASVVVSGEQVGEILAHAPSRFSTSPALRLLYSTRMDGISLTSMYAKCKNRAPTLLAIRDSGGARFGCFVTAPWTRETKPTYYGSGESFCWKAQDGGSDGGESVNVYTWSRRNKYFQCSTAGYVALGGGGHFALRLDDDLMRGSSGACETYGSPCLASGEEFECVVLELWAVETARGSLYR